MRKIKKLTKEEIYQLVLQQQEEEWRQKELERREKERFEEELLDILLNEAIDKGYLK